MYTTKNIFKKGSKLNSAILLRTYSEDIPDTLTLTKTHARAHTRTRAHGHAHAHAHGHTQLQQEIFQENSRQTVKRIRSLETKHTNVHHYMD